MVLHVEYFMKITSEYLQILMPVFPGQLRYIRKNFFHAVAVIDPATICGLEASSCFHLE